MDFTQTLTLLKVNGLTPQSTPEEITTFLKRANYSDGDIAWFLQQLQSPQPAPAPAPAPVAAPVVPTPVSAAPAALSSTDAPGIPPTTPLRTTGGHGWIGTAVFVVVFLLILGAGGYTAFAMYGIPAQEGALSSFQSSFSMKKYHMNFVIQSEATSTDQQFSFSAPTDVDATDPKALKLVMKPDLEAGNSSASGEIRYVDDTLYMKLTSLIANGSDQSEMIGTKWYSFTKSDLKDLPGSTDLSDEFSSTTAKERFDEFMKAGIITPKGKPVLSFEGSTPVVTYTFSIDADKLVAFESKSYPQPAAMWGTSTTFGPLVITKNLLTNQLKSIDGTITLTEPSYFGEEAQTRTYSYHIDYTPLTSVTIQKPDGATSLLSMINQSLGVARSKGQDAMIQSNLDTIRVQAEVYYNGDGNNAYGSHGTDSCTASTAGTFLTDSFVKTALAEIPGEKACHISNNGSAYALSAALTSRPGWWCVDSTGVSSEYPTNPLSAPGTVACK